MNDRKRLCIEMTTASATRHALCFEALRRISQLRQAVLAVQLGEDGAVDALDGLCAHLSHDGAVWSLRLDPLLQAERERLEAMRQLEELDGARSSVE